MTYDVMMTRDIVFHRSHCHRYYQTDANLNKYNYKEINNVNVRSKLT